MCSLYFVSLFSFSCLPIGLPTLFLELQFMGWKDSIEIKALTLYAVSPFSIPGTAYGLMSTSSGHS